MGLITIALLLASGALEMYFGYRESRQHIAQLQSVLAEAAAKEIEQYLRTIEAGLRDATKLSTGNEGDDLQRLREEFYRLMVLFPAITDLQSIDAQQREQLFVSKSEPDRMHSLDAFADRELLAVSSDAPVRYGGTFYRDGAEPFVRMAIARRDAQKSVTVAAINLRFLGDVVSGLRVGESGLTFVVDASYHLIAHPRPTHVLRKLDLSTFAPVAAARQVAPSGTNRLLDAIDTVDLDGRPVIATAMRLPLPHWLLFVEQPRFEAMQPALATLTRTVLLLALGGGLALIASVLFSRRMAAPIVGLRHATERFAAGDLSHHIDVGSGDEIELLADDFNDMAQKLRESYAGLEAKVEVRTAELSEARDKLHAQAREMESLNAVLVAQLTELALRKEEAERANAAKTRFLAAASHDLRQPMHSISLLVSVLRDRLEKPEHVDLAQKVELSVSAMENLFSSLLDISKLDAGAVRPDLAIFDLDGVLRQIEHAYRPQATARGLSFKVMRSRGVVRTDPALLERILGNLVANAIRYTRTGGVLVGCRHRAGSLAVQVLDTGIGVPAEHLEDIFDEFFRLNPHGQGPEPSKGLGLGLAIVKRSAEILGLDLAVRSQVGRGSVFEVSLPRATAAPVPLALGQLDPPERQRVSGAFVLIVDDDDENRSALETVCSQWGCHVLATRSVDDALLQLQGHLRPPDLILTDYRLGPQRDGFEVIERVRRMTGEATAAIIVTADVAAGLQTRASNAGAVLMHKPASADRLHRAAVAAMKPRVDAAAAGDPGQ